MMSYERSKLTKGKDSCHGVLFCNVQFNATRKFAFSMVSCSSYWP